MAGVYNEDGLRCPFCNVKPWTLHAIDSRTTGLLVWVCTQCCAECHIARQAVAC